MHTQAEVDACEKAIDESLQNDQALHAPPLHGQRASIACVACARVKTKCDQQNPCGYCRSKGLTCTPRIRKRIFPDFSSLADAPILDPEIASGQDPDDGIVEVATRVPGRNSPPQDHSPILEADEDSQHFGGQFPPPSGQMVHQPPTTDYSASQQMSDHAPHPNHPPPTTLSGLLPPESIPPAYSVQNTERYFGVSRLPQLDWQSLTANPTPSQYPNIRPVPNTNTAEANALQSSGLPTFGVFQGYPGVEEDQSVLNSLNNELLFSFNVEENAWETRLSALSSIMGDCFQPHQTVPPVASNAPHSETERTQNGTPGGSTSEAQNWSPQIDMQIPSDLVLADKELDQWALGQCTKSSNEATTYSSPADHPMHQDFTTWSYAVERYRDSCFEPHERIENVDLTDETRDWMLIAIQQFLRAGMESQDAQKLSELLEVPPGAAAHSFERFLLLPPKTSLQKYLDIFLTTFEPFTPMIPALSLNPNKLASRSREREATLLLFLMIAFGSMIDPAPRARQFSYELTEVCRHSLRRVTDSGGVTKQDALTLHCALIFTCLSSYSGRRSHMDRGNAQRHMYLAVGSQFVLSCSSRYNLLEHRIFLWIRKNRQKPGNEIVSQG